MPTNPLKRREAVTTPEPRKRFPPLNDRATVVPTPPLDRITRSQTDTGEKADFDIKRMENLASGPSRTGYDPRHPYRDPGESEVEEENRRNKSIPPDYGGPGMPREPGMIGDDALDTQSRDARWYHYMKRKKKASR